MFMIGWRQPSDKLNRPSTSWQRSEPGSSIRLSIRPTAVEASLAKPGEEQHPCHQDDSADHEDPDNGSARTNQGVDEQEPQGEEEEQDPYPGAATTETYPVAAAGSIPVSPLGLSPWIGPGIALSRRAGEAGTGDNDALTPLHLSEPADLVSMLPGVPTRVDPLRQQVLGRDAEDLGDVCPDQLLSGSLRGTVGGVCVAVDRVRIDAQVFHLPVRIGDRSIIAGRNGPVWLPARTGHDQGRTTLQLRTVNPDASRRGPRTRRHLLVLCFLRLSRQSRCELARDAEGSGDVAEA